MKEENVTIVNDGKYLVILEKDNNNYEREVHYRLFILFKIEIINNI